MLELKSNNNRWNLSKRTVEGLEVMNPQPMHNPLKVPSCQRDDNDSEHSVLLAVTPVYCPSPFHGLQAPLLEVCLLPDAVVRFFILLPAVRLS